MFNSSLINLIKPSESLLKIASTRIRSQPERMSVLSALPPKTKLNASKIILLPAPVSPLITLSPLSKLNTTLSIKATFSIFSVFSII